jgi:beta-lactamase class A
MHPLQVRNLLFDLVRTVTLPDMAAGRSLFLFAVVVSFLGNPAAAWDEPSTAKSGSVSLAGRIEPLILAHKGKVSVAVKNLRTGESFQYQADRVMPTASLIKFPVMIEAYRQAAAGQINLDAMLTLKNEIKVPGSGVLTYHFSAGSSFPLRDAIRLMIAYSDNTATNMVLDAIGLGATAATMESMGYPHTKIHSKVFHRETSVFPKRSAQFGLGSTTAFEMVWLCEALYYRRLVNSTASQAMLVHMRACDDKDKFPRFLPPGTKIAFKTGSLANTRTAAGIIECAGGPVALCVLSSENQDQRWVPDNAGNLLCARIAREVFSHFQQPIDKGDSATQAQTSGSAKVSPGRIYQPASGR